MRDARPGKASFTRFGRIDEVPFHDGRDRRQTGYSVPPSSAVKRADGVIPVARSDSVWLTEIHTVSIALLQGKYANMPRWNCLSISGGRRADCQSLERNLRGRPSE